MSSITDKLTACATNHGEDCGEIEAAFNDLSVLASTMWGLMTAEQRMALLSSPEVETIIELGARDEFTASDLQRSMEQEPLPGLSSLQAMEVDMTEVLGPYDAPEQNSEWVWVASVASFAHTKNGVEGGTWEFMVHVETICTGDYQVPEALKPYFERAEENGYAWVLFYH